MIPGVGPVNARRLLSYCGTAEAVFRENNQRLKRIPGIGEGLARAVTENKSLKLAEQELQFCERFKIRIFFYLDEDYPFRLRQCADSPLVFFYKGSAALNQQRVIALVGTRKATPYGKEACRVIVEALAPYKTLVVSGLAYGIDTCSHRYALEYGLETVGVLGHGLDSLYPASNKGLAEKMLRQGGLLTDFPSGTRPDKMNFPSRNRIIAGMSDAVVVVEGAREGGALITADIANSYSRDVFSVPGRWGDTYSEGCNHLISANRAALIHSPADLIYQLGWENPSETAGQQALLLNLTQEEETLVHLIHENGDIGIDALCLASGYSLNKVSCTLLGLEMNRIIVVLPGKRYAISRPTKK